VSHNKKRVPLSAFRSHNKELNRGGDETCLISGTGSTLSDSINKTRTKYMKVRVPDDEEIKGGYDFSIISDEEDSDSGSSEAEYDPLVHDKENIAPFEPL